MQAELQDVIEKYQEKLLELHPDLISYLIAGDLHKFETELFQSCTDLYNQLAFVILSAVAQSEELKQTAQVIGQKKGLKELRKSAATLQLKTGAMVTIFSWYASRAKSKRKTNKRGPNGTGCHLLLD